MVFSQKLALRLVLGLFLYGFGACLILSLYLTAEEQCWNRRYENIFITALLNQKSVSRDTEVQETHGSVDPGSYIAGMVIWSLFFLDGYGYYLYSLVQSHQEFRKKFLYYRRTACVGKENFRISACVDLMTEEAILYEKNSDVSYPAVGTFLCSTDSVLRLVHGKCGSSS